MSHLCAIWLVTLANTMSEPPPSGIDEERAVEVCQMVVESAEEHDVDPSLAVAVAWHESRLRFGLVSPCGAEGPMQVIARYWCADARGGWTPNGEHVTKGCDLVDAGTRALDYYLTKHRSIGAALRAYGGSRDYADRVLILAEAIKY